MLCDTWRILPSTFVTMVPKPVTILRILQVVPGARGILGAPGPWAAGFQNFEAVFEEPSSAARNSGLTWEDMGRHGASRSILGAENSGYIYIIYIYIYIIYIYMEVSQAMQVPPAIIQLLGSPMTLESLRKARGWWSKWRIWADLGCQHLYLPQIYSS